MSKFKVGDKLICVQGSGLCKVGDKVTFHGYYESAPFPSDKFLQIKEFIDKYPSHNQYSHCFELYKEPQMKFIPMPELKTGMRVTLKRGGNYIVINEVGGGRIFRRDAYMNLKSFDLQTGKYSEDDYYLDWSIVKVWQGDTEGYSEFLNPDWLGSYGDIKPIWEYEDPVIEKTEADILREQLEALKAKLRELGEEE